MFFVLLLKNTRDLVLITRHRERVEFRQPLLGVQELNHNLLGSYKMEEISHMGSTHPLKIKACFHTREV
jgi:hypothetical protein